MNAKVRWVISDSIYANNTVLIIDKIKNKLFDMILLTESEEV